MDQRLTVLIKNTLSNFGLQFVTMLLGLFVVPIMISAVGEEGYGLLTLAATILGYFSIVGLGIPAGTVKYIAEYDGKDDREAIDRIINTSVAFYLCIGLVAGVTIATFTALGGLRVFNISAGNRVPAEHLMYVAAAFSVVSWPGGIFGQVLSGLQKYHRKNVINATTSSLGLLAAIGAASAGADIVSIFLAQRTGSILAWLLLYREVRQSAPYWSFALSSADRSTLKMIFNFSVWMLLGQIAGLLVYQTDRIIIGAALPVAMLAVYQIVLKPFELVKSLSFQFRSAVMPAVSSTSADDTAAIDDYIYTGSRYSNLFSSMLAVGAVIFAEPFIRIWVGEKYVEYVWIVHTACTFQLLYLSNGFIAQVFRGRGYVMRLSVIALGSALLNVGLSIWWVHVFGVGGVIIATVVVGVLTVPAQYVWLLPVLEVDRPRYFWRSVLVPQLPAIGVGLALVPLWDPLQELTSWWALAGSVTAVGLAMVVIGWLTIVDAQHKSSPVRKFEGETRIEMIDVRIASPCDGLFAVRLCVG